MERPDAPKLLDRLATACDEEGGRALLVGGGIRDFLMERPVKDWDVEVHGLEEPALVAILRRLGEVNAVGRSFGVYKLTRGRSELDVSLPRRDSKIGRGHRGIHVEGDPHMTPTEAARRRDLTVNAIMYDVLTGEILDPFDGRRDLRDRTLRAVDAETFLEDPLRALRVVQFAARLEFQPTQDLIALCQRAKLDELPAERVQEEWRKLLLAENPAHGLGVARASGVLERVFPEAAAFDDLAVDGVLTRMALRDFEGQGRRLAAMLCAWLHRADPDAVERTLDRLWLHKWRGYPLRDQTLAAIAAWPSPTPDDAALRHLSTRAELELTLTVRWAVREDDALERLERARTLGIRYEKPPRLLLGRHVKQLGVKPGPLMGEILAKVYELQLDGEVTSLNEAIAAARDLV